jgi:hypothetical protein
MLCFCIFLIRLFIWAPSVFLSKWHGYISGETEEARVRTWLCLLDDQTRNYDVIEEPNEADLGRSSKHGDADKRHKQAAMSKTRGPLLPHMLPWLNRHEGFICSQQYRRLAGMSPFHAPDSPLSPWEERVSQRTIIFTCRALSTLFMSTWS